MFEFKRSEENPILIPKYINDWEAEAVFNGCPVIDDKGMINFLYRAVSSSHASSIGYASSNDGAHFKNRRQFIKPEYGWERFGCEDPRVTKFEDKYYIFYTALSTFPFNADGIKVGVAVTKDFKTIDEKHLVTPFNAKAMALFPEKINGLMTAVLSVDTDRPPVKICIASFDHEDQIWSPDYWKEWHKSLDKQMLSLARSPQDHIEVGAPPIKTEHGWLLIYSYIQNYFSPPASFGIEAVLLDLDNPRKIIARTEKPILTVREEYEKYGVAPNIVFPSGAFVRDGKIYLYYGAADTVCALAIGEIDELLKELLKSPLFRLEKFSGNPIMKPLPENSWESKAVFNTGALYENEKIHLVYRAMSEDNTSVLGYASTRDGFTLDERLSKPIYVPREDFEKKGCEDPRLTRMGDIIYMFYTAYDGKNMPRVALTSIACNDFIKHKWNWAKPVLISPPDVADKNAALFPKKIKGKYAILHRLEPNIWIDFVDDLNLGNGKWLEGFVLMIPRLGHKDSKKIGIAGPPIETSEGWLLIYHGISKKADNHYHLRAALLDLEDPTHVVARTRETILEPETSFEKQGLVPNVVFSNGMVVKDGRLFVYYGGADKVICVATTKISDLVQRLIDERDGRIGLLI
ncbi:MAG: hypothetical protein AAB847_01310 [Patescibacteria group bacterium]